MIALHQYVHCEVRDLVIILWLALSSKTLFYDTQTCLKHHRLDYLFSIVLSDVAGSHLLAFKPVWYIKLDSLIQRSYVGRIRILHWQAVSCECMEIAHDPENFMRLASYSVCSLRGTITTIERLSSIDSLACEDVVKVCVCIEQFVLLLRQAHGCLALLLRTPPSNSSFV